MIFKSHKARNDRLCIGHLVENLEVGGLEKLLVEFARHTDRARFDLKFLTLGIPGSLKSDIEAEGWEVESLNFGEGLRPTALFKILSWLIRSSIDVLHVHTSGPLIYGTIAGKLAGVSKIISTRHHGPDINNSPRAIRACTFLSNWIDQVVCVSEDGVIHSLKEGIHESQLTKIWNGIDLNRFVYAGPDANGPAAIVARLNPEKDHETLIRAVAIVNKRSPDFKLAIAGDGPCETRLRALVQELELTHVVSFLGKVDDVPTLLKSSSVLILSSIKEGISLTLLEAMATGLPVIATEVGGNPEVILQEETGLLVPPASPSELAEAILKIWNDPELSRRLGRAGRDRAVDHFDVHQMLRNYSGLYMYGLFGYPQEINKSFRGYSTLELPQ